MNYENENNPYSEYNINPLGTVRHVESSEMKRFRDRSLAGEARRRDRQRKRQISQDDYNHRKNTIIATAITVALAVGSAASLPHGVRKIHEWQVEHDPIVRITDEYSHVVSESIVGRSPDGYEPIYDYYKIAQHIIHSGHFDDSLFATYNSLSLRTNIETNTQVTQEQVIQDLNQILNHTEYGNLNNYLAQRGYSSIQDWESDMVKRIQLIDDMNQSQESYQEELQQMSEELQKMEQEHPLTESQGGKRL